MPTAYPQDVASPEGLQKGSRLETQMSRRNEKWVEWFTQRGLCGTGLILPRTCDPSYPSRVEITSEQLSPAKALQPKVFWGGFIDLAHAARAEGRFDLVGAESSAWAEWHGLPVVLAVSGILLPVCSGAEQALGNVQLAGVLRS